MRGQSPGLPHRALRPPPALAVTSQLRVSPSSSVPMTKPCAPHASSVPHSLATSRAPHATPRVAALHPRSLPRAPPALLHPTGARLPRPTGTLLTGALRSWALACFRAAVKVAGDSLAPLNLRHRFIRTLLGLVVQRGGEQGDWGGPWGWQGWGRALGVATEGVQDARVLAGRGGRRVGVQGSVPRRGTAGGTGAGLTAGAGRGAPPQGPAACPGPTAAGSGTRSDTEPPTGAGEGTRGLSPSPIRPGGRAGPRLCCPPSSHKPGCWPPPRSVPPTVGSPRPPSTFGAH